jgi:hypothetical protein
MEEDINRLIWFIYDKYDGQEFEIYTNVCKLLYSHNSGMDYIDCFLLGINQVIGEKSLLTREKLLSYLNK